MDSLRFEYAPGKFLGIGYRSPGLSKECTPGQKMELAAELGMEVIEPQLADKEFPEIASAHEYRRAADENGIRIETAGTPIRLAGTTDRADLDRQIDRMLEFAQILGFSYAFNCVEHPPEGDRQEDVWNRLAGNIRHCIRRFGASGLRFAIEPEWFVASVERMQRLHRLVDDDALLVNYDPTNFYVGGSDVFEALDAFPGKIVNGHIKDALYCVTGRKERPVGQGEIDYRAIFESLMARGMSLNMHIEHCGSAEAVRAAAAHIAPIIRELKTTASAAV